MITMNIVSLKPVEVLDEVLVLPLKKLGSAVGAKVVVGDIEIQYFTKISLVVVSCSCSDVILLSNHMLNENKILASKF